MDPVGSVPAPDRPITAEQVEFRWTAGGYRPVATSKGITQDCLNLLWQALHGVVGPPRDVPDLINSVVYKPLRVPLGEGPEPVGAILLRMLDVDVAPSRVLPAGPGHRVVTRLVLVPDLDLASAVALGICAGGAQALPPPAPGRLDFGAELAQLGRDELGSVLAATRTVDQRAQLAEPRIRRLLVSLVSRLLEQPDAVLSVQLPHSGVNVPAPSGGPPAVQLPLLMALTSLAGRMLAGLPAQHPAPWDGGFATYEDSGAPPAPWQRPQIIFESASARAAVPGSWPGRHQAVQLDRPDEVRAHAPAVLQAAEILVARYLDRADDWLAQRLGDLARRGLSLSQRIVELTTDAAPAVGLAAQAYTVPCPICLQELAWDRLEPHVLDRASGSWQPVRLAADASPEQRRRAEQSAVVICPNARDRQTHVLPLAYGRHGRPVVIGLVGRTASGKSHLLSALVKQLSDPVVTAGFGVSSCVPVDAVRHRVLMERRVDPLFATGRVIPATAEGITSFADAFQVTSGAVTRVVAIFDVAGGDLQRVDDHKEFLYLADGLLFVADPTALQTREGTVEGDRAFDAVLDLLGSGQRSSSVAAAIALTKADRLRFEEPIDRWLREPVSLSPQAVRAESRDVFAYLVSRGGQSWLRPFLECGKASLHVVSATGGSAVRVGDGDLYPRGVASHRVLGPFLALLAMTGALAGEGYETIGVR